MKKFVRIIAFGGGLGYLPWMPGTWGSLMGIPMAYGFSFFPFYLSLLSFIAFFFLSVWVSGMAELESGKKDNPSIVIDEICGMTLALFSVPLTLSHVLIAFSLFRFFDIAKIPPARWVEQKCPGGYGIVLDDVVAGAYVRGCMAVIISLGV